VEGDEIEKQDKHFISGGGRIRPVENLRAVTRSLLGGVRSNGAAAMAEEDNRVKIPTPPNVRISSVESKLEWSSLACPHNALFRPQLTPIHRKVPWRLSSTRKANQRARLKNVDAVIEAVRASGVSCNALVSSSQTFIYILTSS